MISLFRWHIPSEFGKWEEVTDPNSIQSLTQDNQNILWIDLTNPSEELEKTIFGEVFPVHALTLEDITKPRREPEQALHFPKVEEFHDYLFVVVNPLRTEILDQMCRGERDKQHRHPNVQLSAIIASNILITHHYHVLESIEAVKQFLARHPDQAKRGPDFLFHLVLDSMVDEYAPVVDRLADNLDGLETHMFVSNSTQATLSRLIRMKRAIVALRKTLILEREVLSRLIRGEFRLVVESEIVYYRNVYDHLVRYTELIESAREMVSDLMQTYLATTSNRLNGIMKVLTMISTILLPMTLIASIYGMNFEQSYPDFKWEYGFFFTLGSMLLAALASFSLFYYRKWI